MLSEKPLTPTVAHTSADPGVFKQGKQDVLHRCVSAPKRRGNPFRGENSVSRKKNEITAEGPKILQWSARRQIPVRYLITNSTGMSGTGF